MIDICVDFDGTLVDHAFPEIGAAVPHAAETIKWLMGLPYVTLILLTMRSTDMRGHDYLTEAVEYCKSMGMIFDHVNDNPTQIEWTNSKKVYGKFYIDNANLGCPLIEVEGFYRPCVDWNIIRNELLTYFGRNEYPF